MSFQDSMEKMRKTFREAMLGWQREHDVVWEGLTSEQKLAAADVIFRAIDQHAREGGSYRHLIYDRLGLGHDSYAVLQCAGALTLSNFYDLSKDAADETD